jgi:hypothetical protein
MQTSMKKMPRFTSSVLLSPDENIFGEHQFTLARMSLCADAFRG